MRRDSTSPRKGLAVITILLAGGCYIVWLILSLSIFLTLAGGFSSSFFRGEWGPLRKTPTPVIASRTVVGSTLPLREQWRWNEGLFVGDGDIVAAGDFVCIAAQYYDGWLPRDRVYILNARDGKTLWKVEKWRTIFSMATNGQQLFIIADWRIWAYDLVTGELLWYTPQRLEGYPEFQAVHTEFIVVYIGKDSLNRTEHILQQYNSRDGLLTELFRLETPEQRLLARTSSMDYWTGGKSFWAEDRELGQVHWQVNLERALRYRPVVVGSTVIYADGFYPRLYALDSATGVLQWMYSGPLVSNFALSGDVIYAFQQDGKLVEIALRTGKAQGYVQFSPEKTEEGSPRSFVYWVAASDGRVFMYFGDSRELIALGP